MKKSKTEAESKFKMQIAQASYFKGALQIQEAALPLLLYEYVPLFNVQSIPTLYYLLMHSLPAQQLHPIDPLARICQIRGLFSMMWTTHSSAIPWSSSPTSYL